MLRRLWRGPERRSFERREIALEIELEVELYGFEDESRPFFASGRTLNLSRSGALTRVDLPVAPGSVCKIFFRHADDVVRPHHTAGRVLRAAEVSGGFEIAIEFDEPLIRLRQEDAATRTAPR